MTQVIKIDEKTVEVDGVRYERKSPTRPDIDKIIIERITKGTFSDRYDIYVNKEHENSWLVPGMVNDGAALIARDIIKAFTGVHVDESDIHRLYRGTP